MKLEQRRYYTPDQANRSLPLVAAIARDVADGAQDIRRVWLELKDFRGDSTAREALLDSMRDLEERFARLNDELDELGVELKDPFTGLLDFRAQRQREEVYLCWKLGEQHVDHWHTLEGGFAARRPLSTF